MGKDGGASTEELLFSVADPSFRKIPKVIHVSSSLPPTGALEGRREGEGGFRGHLKGEHGK